MSATYSMMLDWSTGEVSFRGTDGKIYSEAELLAAEDGAARGDEAAKATLAVIERPAPASREEAQRMIEAEMDDCPLCVEARARGDQPVFVSHGDGAAIDGWWRGRRPKRRGRR